MNLLNSARGERRRSLIFLVWPSLLEKCIIIAAFAYIIKRWTKPDRLFLGIVACILLGISVFDTQGYFASFNTLYILPIGTLLVHGFSQPGDSAISYSQSRFNLLVTGCVTIMMIGQGMNFVDWGGIRTWLQTGSLPEYVYEAIGRAIHPYIQDNDRIVSTHLLLWSLPNHINLISIGSELYAIQRWNLSNSIGVWERVKPDIIIYIETQMDWTPGLQRYMQEHKFELCKAIPVENLMIQLFRPDCLVKKMSSPSKIFQSE